jgi:hypothetical protein
VGGVVGWAGGVGSSEASLTLLEAVRDLDSFDSMSTIFAVEPFSEHSEVVVSDREESEIAPKWAVERGVTYFLEVFIPANFSIAGSLTRNRLSWKSAGELSSTRLMMHRTPN